LKDFETAKSEDQQKLERCEAQHAELVAAVEDLETQLKRTKQERDDCRNKDLASSKEKIEQLEIEVDTVRKALRAGQAELETAKEELEALRNFKSSETGGSADADAQKQIRLQDLTHRR
jgi:outer membrane murein-binding lipoprotein Lpp